MLALATLCQRVDPARTAVVQGGQRWTYGELDRASARLAGMLRQCGVVADGLVAYSLPNGPGFLALTLAIYRCGATPAPLSPACPSRNARRSWRSCSRAATLPRTMWPRSICPAMKPPRPRR
ncbi:AMP-binding protein [Novosphingobium colocasiae]